MMIPPKPAARAGRVSLWRYLQLFKQDILSAQPARLYGAKMAEFKTPFFRSYLVNQPDLVAEILRHRPQDFPKSDRISEGLRPLLGNSVFVTNGPEWQRQRCIIDPAFEGGRVKHSFAAMQAAGQAAVGALRPGTHEVEQITSHLAADVIFRALFSIPIQHDVAQQVFGCFRAYQRAQPLVNLAAFVPLPRLVPRGHGRKARRAAKEIRQLITALAENRQAEIAQGHAPDDLATRIMTTRDPETGTCFETREMVDQIAIFFLAGHETSASALAWALYLLATHPAAQERVAQEARLLDDTPQFAQLSKLRFTRDVFRETLRLYPPVPMMVRSATRTEHFRNRTLRPGSQIVLSPWHLHRHTSHWPNPDMFDPDRFAEGAGSGCPQAAYFPFSAGARVCSGAGFAMAEGTLLLAMLMRAWKVAPAGATPVPVAHLTVRSKTGIHLTFSPREG